MRERPQTQKPVNKYQEQVCCKNECDSKTEKFTPIESSLANISNAVQSIYRLIQLVREKEDYLFGSKNRVTGEDAKSESIGRMNDLVDSSVCIRDAVYELEKELQYLLERIK